MTSYPILVSNNAVSCHAEEEELGINVSDIVSYIGGSSAPCTAATDLLKRS